MEFLKYGHPPGTHKPILGDSKWFMMQSYNKGYPARAKGNGGEMWLCAHNNDINSREEIYLNETISMEEAMGLWRVSKKELIERS